MVSKKNMEKYATYKSMMENLSKAMRSEFYYQAIFIVCIMGLKPSPLGETFRSKEGTLRLVGVKKGILTLR